jgi:uncharacterized protein (TIGR02001 family)
MLMKLLFACAAAGLTAPAGAETRAEAPLDLEFTLDAVSDYRFRGISLSDRRPALQPGVTLTHRSGLYASAWASTLAEDGGPDVELDLVAGYSRPLGPVTLDLSGIWYVYPGDREAEYLELIYRASTPIGPAEAGLTVAWAPAQNNLGDRSNRYAALDVSLPLPRTPLTLAASFGIEDGAFGDRKRDWSLGLSGEVAGFALGASYIDTARANAGRLGRAGLVLSAGRTF